MFEFEILVRKLLAVDRFTASTITSSEVTALYHKGLDNSVERRALVAEPISGLAVALLASAKASEVLRGFWHHIVELYHYDQLLPMTIVCTKLRIPCTTSRRGEYN